jgi:hypothetical protein
MVKNGRKMTKLTGTITAVRTPKKVQNRPKKGSKKGQLTGTITAAGDQKSDKNRGIFAKICEKLTKFVQKGYAIHSRGGNFGGNSTKMVHFGGFQCQAGPKMGQNQGKRVIFLRIPQESEKCSFLIPDLTVKMTKFRLFEENGHFGEMIKNDEFLRKLVKN